MCCNTQPTQYQTNAHSYLTNTRLCTIAHNCELIMCFYVMVKFDLITAYICNICDVYLRYDTRLVHSGYRCKLLVNYVGPLSNVLQTKLLWLCCVSHFGRFENSADLYFVLEWCIMIHFRAELQAGQSSTHMQLYSTHEQADIVLFE